MRNFLMVALFVLVVWPLITITFALLVPLVAGVVALAALDEVLE